MESDRIESLVARCEAIPDPALRADVLELVRLVLEFHGDALATMLQAAAEAPHLEALLAAWRRSAAISAVLQLHDLAFPKPPPPSLPQGDFVPLATLTP